MGARSVESGNGGQPVTKTRKIVETSAAIAGAVIAFSGPVHTAAINIADALRYPPTVESGSSNTPILTVAAETPTNHEPPRQAQSTASLFVDLATIPVGETITLLALRRRLKGAFSTSQNPPSEEV